MRRLVVLALALVLLGAPAKAQVTLALSCGAVGTEFELCREGAEEWARRTGNRIRMVSMPAGGSERLALLQQLLASRSANLDVIQADVVWPGILANHLLDLSGRVETEGHFPTILANNTVDGRLLAVPWFTNTGLLYYRRDLLERHGRRVPETWAELTETAEAVMQAERAAGSERMWGYVFQARAYEGLTVNALEWLAAHGAGTVVEPDGRISVDNPRAAQAISRAAGWVAAIAPQGVLNYTEEEARGVFQSGQAVFMRNWPYASPLLDAPDSPVRGQVGVTRLPRTEHGPHAAGLGGENLAVSRYTAHPEAAVDLIRHLTSRAEQRRRAIAAGLPPTYPDLYEDAEMIAAQPLLRDIARAVPDAVPRPSAATGVRYNRVSAEFANAVHAVLSGRLDAAESLERLEARLQRVSRGGAW
ncbi:MAG TPA: ABC transporter substrate-binding protein [Acetobacteraceae bacterium]|nr:ABC transporter substrate-binding protein [Acetobacteraceae bacterium]